jgi:hypothetical protein
MLISDRTASLQLRVDAGAMTAMLAGPAGSVTAAVENLCQLGAITTRPGLVTISSREALEVAACECYETVREAYARTLAS